VGRISQGTLPRCGKVLGASKCRKAIESSFCMVFFLTNSERAHLIWWETSQFIFFIPLISFIGAQVAKMKIKFLNKNLLLTIFFSF
jgi:hypothetical protein